MPRSDESRTRADFGQRYAVDGGDVSARIEHAVIGAAWGANGYTTLGQADEIRRRLELQPGSWLLDAGTGRGWPGLYLAKQTGCRLVASDLPIEGLFAANRRARREEIADRVALVSASAADLPFRSSSFDAVVHTDVLC